jgi:hypothetical protein
MLAIVDFYYTNKICGFEVLTMVTVKSSCVISVVMPCSVKVPDVLEECVASILRAKKKISQV